MLLFGAKHSHVAIVVAVMMVLVQVVQCRTHHNTPFSPAHATRRGGVARPRHNQQHLQYTHEESHRVNGARDKHFDSHDVPMHDLEEEVIGQGFPSLASTTAVLLPTIQQNVPPSEQDKFESSALLNATHDATLTDLYTSAGRPVFDGISREYITRVEGSVVGVTVTAVPNCNLATLVIAGIPAESGVPMTVPRLNRVSNLVDVVVTSRDKGLSLTYRLNIIRAIGRSLVPPTKSSAQQREEPASSLAALNTSLTDLVFNARTYQWEGSVGAEDEDVTSVMAVPTNPNALVLVALPGADPVAAVQHRSAKLPLREGDNMVRVLVTAPDRSSSKTYFVNIIKKKAEEVKDTSVCEGNCSGHGECEESSRLCVCKPHWVRRDCSTWAGENAYEMEIDEPSPDALLNADPADSSAWLLGSTHISAYGLRACSRALQQWTEPSGLPEACKTPINYCRRVMGVLLKGDGDVRGMCVDHIRKCFVSGEDFPACYFRVVTPRSGDSRLVALDICPGKVTRYMMVKNRFFGEVNSEVQKVTVKPIAVAYALISVNGIPVDVHTGESVPIALLPGPNKISLVVTAEDRVSVNTYSLVVTRSIPTTEPTQVTPFLSDLRPIHAPLTPLFTPNRHLYHVKVESWFETFALTPYLTANSSEASSSSSSSSNGYITVAGTAVLTGTMSPNVNLLPGPNVVPVVVRARDGVTTETYIIVVIRALESKSLEADATLKRLSGVSGWHQLDPPFQPSVFAYSLVIDHDCSEIVLSPTPTHPLATVTIDGSAVANGAVSEPIFVWYGKTHVAVVVTAPDIVTSRTYVVRVSRKFREREDPIVPMISGIFFDAGLTLDTEFEVSKSEYILKVPTDEEFTMLRAVVSPGAFVSVSGSSIAPGNFSRPIRLSAGGASRIEVQVHSEYGSVAHTYAVVLIRELQEVTMLQDLRPSIGTLEPRFEGSWLTYELMLSPRQSNVKYVTFTTTHSPNDASVLIDGNAVVSGQPSKNIELLRNFETTIISVVMVPKDEKLKSRTYSIRVRRQELEWAVTDYYSYAASFGKVPDKEDKQVYCRLDRCREEVVQLAYRSVTNVLPPSCNTAIGQSLAVGKYMPLVTTQENHWKAHFQCPMSAQCMTLHDCTALVLECLSGVGITGMEQSNRLKSWYEKTIEMFQTLDVESRGHVSSVQLQEGLMNILKLDQEVAEGVIGQIQFDTLPRSDGSDPEHVLPLFGYLYNVVHGIIPTPFKLSQEELYKIRELYEQFQSWQCPKAGNVACVDKISAGLVAQGYSPTYSLYVANQMNALGNGEVNFDLYMVSIFNGLLPMDHVVALKQERELTLLRQLVNEFLKFRGKEEHQDENAFSRMTKAQDCAQGVSDSDISIVFQACSKKGVMTFRDMYRCATSGLMWLDMVDPLLFGSPATHIDTFRSLDAANTNRITRRVLEQFVSGVSVFQPALDVEKQFSQFLALSLDDNDDADISITEFMRGAANRLLPPRDTPYAWLRLFETWYTYDHTEHTSSGVGVEQLIDVLQSKAKMSLEAASFLTNTMANTETGKVRFRDMVEVSLAGVGTYLAPAFQPQLTEKDVTKIAQRFEKDSNEQMSARDYAGSLSRDLMVPPHVANTLVSMVANKGSIKKLTDSDLANVQLTPDQILAGFFQGYLPIKQFGKGVSKVLKRVLEQSAIDGSVMTFAQVRNLIDSTFKTHGFDDRLINILVIGADPNSTGRVVVEDLLKILMCGMTASWGRLGELAPSEMPYRVLRAMLTLYMQATVSPTSDDANQIRSFMISTLKMQVDMVEVTLDLLHTTTTTDKHRSGSKLGSSDSINDDNDDDQTPKQDMADSTAPMLTLLEFAQGFRLGLIPASPHDAMTSHRMFSAISKLYRKLQMDDKKSGTGNNAHSVSRDAVYSYLTAGTSLRADSVDLVMSFVDATDNGPKNGRVSRKALFYGCLLGIIPVEASEESFQTLGDAVKDLWKQEVLEQHASVAPEEIMSGLKKQGFTELESRTITSAVFDGKSDRINMWEFARAAAAGTIPLTQFVFGDTNTANGSSDGNKVVAKEPTGDQKNDKQLTRVMGVLDEFLKQNPAPETSTLAPDTFKKFLITLEYDEPTATRAMSALDPTVNDAVGLPAFSLAFQSGLLEGPSGRLQSAIEAEQAIAQLSEGQRTLAVANYLKTQGFGEGVSDFLARAVSVPQGPRQGSVDVLAGVVQGVMPYAVSSQHRLTLYVAATAWYRMVSTVGAGSQLTLQTVADLFVSHGFKKEDAVHIANAMARGTSSQVSFVDFFQMVRQQALPISLESIIDISEAHLWPRLFDIGLTLRPPSLADKTQTIVPPQVEQPRTLPGLLLGRPGPVVATKQEPTKQVYYEYPTLDARLKAKLGYVDASVADSLITTSNLAMFENEPTAVMDLVLSGRLPLRFAAGRVSPPQAIQKTRTIPQTQAREVTVEPQGRGAQGMLQAQALTGMGLIGAPIGTEMDLFSRRQQMGRQSLVQNVGDVGYLQLGLEEPGTSDILDLEALHDWTSPVKNTDAKQVLISCAKVDTESAACRRDLETVFGFTPQQAGTLVDSPGKGKLATITDCLNNARGWDCKMLLNAFSTYSTDSKYHIAPSEMVGLLVGMEFTPADAELVAALVDFDGDKTISFHEFVMAWNRDSVPAFVGSGSAGNVIRKIHAARHFFGGQQCELTDTTAKYVSVAQLASKCFKGSLPAGSQATPTDDKTVEAFFNDWVKHLSLKFCPAGAPCVDGVTEDSYVRLVLLGAMPVPRIDNDGQSISFTQNLGVDMIRREFDIFVKSGVSGLMTMDDLVSSLTAVALPEKYRKPLAVALWREMLLSGSKNGVSFKSYLRYVMLGLVPLRINVQVEGSEGDYAAPELLEAAGIASLKSFVECYFNRRKSMIGGGDVRDKEDDMDAAKWRAIQSGEYVAPKIKLDLREVVLVDVNGELVLDFEAEGVTKYQWFHNAVKGPELENGHLRKHVSHGDEGAWRVVAVNDFGDAVESTVCEVRIRAPDKAPELLTATPDGSLVCPKLSDIVPVGGGSTRTLAVHNRSKFKLELRAQGGTGEHIFLHLLPDQLGSVDVTAGLPLRAYDADTHQLVSEFANPKEADSVTWAILDCVFESETEAQATSLNSTTSFQLEADHQAPSTTTNNNNSSSSNNNDKDNDKDKDDDVESDLRPSSLEEAPTDTTSNASQESRDGNDAAADDHNDNDAADE